MKAVELEAASQAVIRRHALAVYRCASMFSGERWERLSRADVLLYRADLGYHVGMLTSLVAEYHSDKTVVKLSCPVAQYPTALELL